MRTSNTCNSSTKILGHEDSANQCERDFVRDERDDWIYMMVLSGIAALMPFSIIVLHAMIAKTTAMTAKGRMERESRLFAPCPVEIAKRSYRKEAEKERGHSQANPL